MPAFAALSTVGRENWEQLTVCTHVTATIYILCRGQLSTRIGAKSIYHESDERERWPMINLIKQGRYGKPASSTLLDSATAVGCYD